MRVNKIQPFDNTKEYILATKQSGQVSILPELDARNLINLPSVSNDIITYNTYEQLSSSQLIEKQMYFVSDEKQMYFCYLNTIYSVVPNVHSHENKDYLDKISEDEEGKLVYNGQTLQEMISEPNPDFQFASNNIIDNKLTLSTLTPIADILFYTDSSKNEKIVVHLPVSLDNNNTYISFQDVDLEDYQYGGVVRFAKGVSSINNNELIYFDSNVEGNYVLDASLGDTYQIIGLTGDLYLNSVNVLNLGQNQTLKVFINTKIINNSSSSGTESGYNVYINNQKIEYTAFFCSFMNLCGTVMFFNSIVEMN